MDIPKLICIVGARPNFVKITPILKALKEFPLAVDCTLVHTGQHYNKELDHDFFHVLNIPDPDINLEVGSASHAMQTATIMQRFEPIVDKIQPDAILVVGDVNSTLACSLVASKKQIPIIHVEAGLRSHDETMPEEVNRKLTDQLSSLLFTTEQSGNDNLLREGIDASKIHLVGNVMIDTLKSSLPKVSKAKDTFAEFKLNKIKGEFGLLTLHRPANVDKSSTLEPIMSALGEISKSLPLIFPVHPRTESKLASKKIKDILAQSNIFLLPPLSYTKLIGLMNESKVVLTDSGGMQEETTALSVPCLTLRENTERPVTVEEGTNQIVGTNRDRILSGFEKINQYSKKKSPQLWDGNAAVRICEIMVPWLYERSIR